MADRFYLDNAGAGNAADRFRSRSADLSGAANELFPTAGCAGDVPTLVGSVMQAASGRLYAFSDELAMLGGLVDETVEVFNQLDVEYTL